MRSEDPFDPSPPSSRGTHWAWTSVGLDATPRCLSFRREKQPRPIVSLMLDRADRCVIRLFADERCEDDYASVRGQMLMPMRGECVDVPMGEWTESGSFGEGPLGVTVDCRDALLSDYQGVTMEEIQVEEEEVEVEKAMGENPEEHDLGPDGEDPEAEVN